MNIKPTTLATALLTHAISRSVALAAAASAAVVLSGTAAHADTTAEIPGIVSLTTSSHFCGGSVLDENTLITAAHCVDGTIARIKLP